MHVIRFLISYVMVSILGVIMLLFLALNHPTVQLDLLGAQYNVSLPWIMGVAAVLGFLIALLMLLPGRIAAMVNNWSLERELREVEQQYEELQMLRARLLADHEALVERHERMLIRFQHLVSDHREVVADQERTLRQIAAPNTAPSVRSAAEPASPPTTRSRGIRSALRLLPPAAPAPAAPATPSPRASAAPPQAHAPAAAPAAHTVGATARDVRAEQPAPQQAAPQEHVQPAESTSSAIAVAPAPAPAAVAASPPASVAVAPARSQPRLVPVLTNPPASPAPAEQPEAQGASHLAAEPHEPRKPLVTAATLRRPVERLREGARQGWQRAEVQTERLRERMTALRAGVGARLQRPRSSADTTGDDEPSQSAESTPYDGD